MISNRTDNANPTTDTAATVSESITVTSSSFVWIRACMGFLSGETTRKGMFALAGQSVASATNFLTGVIIGRACTKEEFGLYMLGFTIMFFVMNIQSSLILTPYMVYSPHLKGSEHAQYTGSSFIHQLGISALAIFALTVLGVVISFCDRPQGLPPVVWALVVVITFIMFRDYARKICFVGLRMKTALLIDCCVALVQISGLLLLAYLGLLSASRAFMVVGIACGIAALGWLISNRKIFALRANKAISDFKRNWSLGKWVFAGTLLWTSGMYIYPWVLSAFHGISSTGVWAACIGIVAVSKPLTLGIQNYLGPKIVHSYVEKDIIIFRQFVLKATVVFSLVLTPLCAILLLFGARLVAIVYGNEYAGNGLLVSILAIDLLVSPATFSFSRALFAIERADVDFAVNWVALFVMLTIGLWLVKSFGPLGVAFGLLLGDAATAAVKYFAFGFVVRSIAARQIG